jgi:hypothetical protein
MGIVLAALIAFSILLIASVVYFILERRRYRQFRQIDGRLKSFLLGATALASLLSPPSFAFCKQRRPTMSDHLKLR